MMRLATRSGLASEARLMARGLLGCFGMLAPPPRVSWASSISRFRGREYGDDAEIRATSRRQKLAERDRYGVEGGVDRSHRDRGDDHHRDERGDEPLACRSPYG